MCFENLLIQERVHIAAVCESWLEPDSNIKINNYNVYRCDRDDGYGGVAVFTHKSVKSQHIGINHDNPHIQLVHVKIHNCTNIENVIAVYCPSSSRTSVRDWDKIFSIARKKTLIIGDFNGHHTNWSRKTDQRGNQILEALQDNSFITLNDGTPTRVKLVDGILQQYSPDISMASSDIAVDFDYTVTNETFGSDHRVVK